MHSDIPDNVKTNKSDLRTLIQGQLVLDRHYEDRMMTALVERFQAIRTEMGYQESGHYDGWMQKRQNAWKEYENDFKHRENNENYGPLYKLFNNSLNIPKRAIRVFKAKACEQLVNTEPFAGLAPEGVEDYDEGIKQAERLFQRKIKDSNAKAAMREGIEQCAVSGEGVLKVTKTVTKSNKRKKGKIWMDGEGRPLQDARGRWVYEDDKFEPDPRSLEGEQLARDPSVKKDPTCYLSTDIQLAIEGITKRNLDIQNIGFEDFFCPLSAPTVHAADMISHTFDFDLDKLWTLTAGMTISPAAKAWRESLHAASGDAKTGAAQPAEHRGETDADRRGPGKLALAETYWRYDVSGNGRAEEIYILWQIDQSGGYPIYYEYLDQVSPTGKRPIEIQRAIPVRGRWYGMGFYELLSNEHKFVDRQWNRIDARNSASGRLTWVRDDAFVEQKYGIPIEFNNPRVYHLNNNVVKAAEAFGFFQVPAMDDNIWKMLSQATQAAQLMTGTMTPADAESANLDITDTATGINALSNESELMSGDTIQDVVRGTQETLVQAAMCIFNEFTSEDEDVKADAREQAIDLLGSEKAEILFKWIDENPPSKLLNHVRLLLTKARSKQQFQANEQAWGFLIGKKSWLEVVQLVQQGAISHEFAMSIKPLFKTMLENLDVENGEMLLSFDPVPPVPVAPTDPATGQPIATATTPI